MNILDTVGPASSTDWTPGPKAASFGRMSATGGLTTDIGLCSEGVEIGLDARSPGPSAAPWHRTHAMLSCRYSNWGFLWEGLLFHVLAECF